MRNYIILNGTNSNTITGLLIQSLAPISKPLMRTEIEEIDGRDGDIITPLGFSAYDKQITIGLYGTYDINAIIAFFNSEGTVTFSNEPDKYYNYQIYDQIDFERLVRFKTATVTLHCQPFKFATTGESQTLSSGNPISDEGTNLVLEGSQLAPFSQFDLKGNTEQDTYTGKNLLNTHGTIDADSLTGSGVSYTINADGTISTSGSNTGAYKSIRFLLTLPAGTYKFSGCPSGGTTSGYSFCVEPRGDSTLQLFDTGNGNEFTLTEQKTIRAYPVRIGADTGVNMNGKVFKPMITVSTASQDYEPYVGGTASPNPDYPQTVQTVTGENTVKIRGKNLLKLTQQASTSNGITATLTDGIIKYSGTASTNWANIAARTYNFIPAGNYMLSMQETFTTNYAYALSVTYTDNTTATFECWKSVSNKRTVTLAKDVASYYVYLTGLTSNTSYSGTISLMLESGSTATTPFEPYQAQSYEINLGKNLFDVNSITENTQATTNGVEDHEVTYSASNYRAIMLIKVEPNSKYTLSIGDTSIVSRIYCVGMKTTTLESGHSFSWVNSGTTITTTSKDNYILGVLNISSGQGTIANVTNANVQLELGSQATSYAAYFTPIELCKIGDYQDYIYKDGADWKIHKACDKYVFDNSALNWGVGTGTGGWVLGHTVDSPFYGKLAVGNANSYQSFCSHFAFQRDSTTWTGDGKCGFNTEGAFWCIYSAKTTKQDFLDWLGAVNPVVYYPLAASAQTDTTITNTALIEQLEAIANQAHAYKTRTYVDSNAATGNVPHIIAATVVGSADGTITNAGNIYSKPKLTVYGSGDIGIYLNGVQMFQIALGSDGYITIDTNLMEAYKDNLQTLKNRQVTGDYSNFKLPVGQSTISFSGIVTSCVAENFSRWL